MRACEAGYRHRNLTPLIGHPVVAAIPVITVKIRYGIAQKSLGRSAWELVHFVTVAARWV